MTIGYPHQPGAGFTGNIDVFETAAAFNFLIPLYLSQSY
jgi:hypothetical protein